MMPNPTPKPTAGDGEIVRRMAAIKRAKREAFEEAADRANRIGEHDPYEVVRIAFLRFSAELRALAKEQGK